MNCQKCQSEIEERDLRRERLSGAAEAHAAVCVACRVFGEERLALRHLIGDLERISAPADFDFRMRARLAAGHNSGSARRASWFNFSPAARSWPLAAGLALVVSASLYFQQRQPDATTAPAATPPAQQTVSVSPVPNIYVAETTSPSGRPLSDESPASVKATSLKTSPAQRRRVVMPMPNPERAGGEIARTQERLEDSNSPGLTGATVSFDSTGATLKERAPIPVQLAAPERPLKVLLRDTSGGARMISVDSVSFGSRDVMGRSATTYVKASLSSKQGVW